MVHIVGAGIGDIGLITVKAAERIKAADMILYDHLANPTLLSYAKDDCRLVYVGKTSKRHSFEQEEINAYLVKYGSELDVVRLKGGDPFVFGRGGEETAELIKHGIEYEVIPGISSSYAAAEYGGIPVTYRGTAASFHVITGHKRNGSETVDYVSLAKIKGTLVFLMGLGAAREIAERLIGYGKSPDTRAAIISRASTEEQKTAVGTLGDLAEIAKQMKPPAVIVVGDAVGHMNKWYKPTGVRVLVTGTMGVNARIRKEFGDITEIPLIKITEINYNKFKTLQLDKFSHIVFTSSVGVRIFFDYMKRAAVDLRKLGGTKLAAVGKGTAASLGERGIFADVIPKVQNSSALADALTGCEKVLVIRAENGSDVILKKLGKKAYDMPLYKTETDHSKRELLNLCVPEADYIVFSSGSAARAYSELSETETGAKFIAIGNETAKAAAEQGIEIYKIAGTADAVGIARCIREDIENEKKTEKAENKQADTGHGA